MPLGALVYASALRRGRRPLAAGLVARASLPSVLSWAMEFTQHFLPGRYPSLMDWALNSLGAAAGAEPGRRRAVGGRGRAAGRRCASTGSCRTAAPRSRCWCCGRSASCIRATCRSARASPGSGCRRRRTTCSATIRWRPGSTGCGPAWARTPARCPGRPKASRWRSGLLGPCLLAFASARPGWRRAVDRADRGGGGAGGQHAVGRAQLRAGARARLGHVDRADRAWRSAPCWRWPASSSGRGRRRRSGWWRCRSTSRWWRRRRPIRTTPTACSSGSRAASSTSTGWRSGSAGCGRSRPAPRCSGGSCAATRRRGLTRPCAGGRFAQLGRPGFLQCSACTTSTTSSFASTSASPARTAARGSVRRPASTTASRASSPPACPGPGGIRVNKAGCLDRCAGGPVAVVYPDETWYTYVDKSDIDEIVDSHLVGGKPVERLLLPPDVGR